MAEISEIVNLRTALDSANAKLADARKLNDKWAIEISFQQVGSEIVVTGKRGQTVKTINLGGAEIEKYCDDPKTLAGSIASLMLSILQQSLLTDEIMQKGFAQRLNSAKLFNSRASLL